MRTTLEIEDDIYLYARQVASAEHVSIGTVVSRLMRDGLNSTTRIDRNAATAPDADGYVYVNGIPVIPGNGRVVTQELIDQIRDQEGI